MKDITAEHKGMISKLVSEYGTLLVGLEVDRRSLRVGASKLSRDAGLTLVYGHIRAKGHGSEAQIAHLGRVSVMGKRVDTFGDYRAFQFNQETKVTVLDLEQFNDNYDAYVHLSLEEKIALMNANADITLIDKVKVTSEGKSHKVKQWVRG